MPYFFSIFFLISLKYSFAIEENLIEKLQTENYTENDLFDAVLLSKKNKKVRNFLQEEVKITFKPHEKLGPYKNVLIIDSDIERDATVYFYKKVSRIHILDKKTNEIYEKHPTFS